MGMTFTAGKQIGDTTDWAFDVDEMTEDFFSQEIADAGNEFPYVPNPKYRADLSLDLSNRNMRIVFDALSIPFEDCAASVGVEQFIGIATAWLQRNIGKTSRGFEPSESQAVRPALVDRSGDIARIIPVARGPRMVEGGLRDGYINEIVAKMVRIAQEGVLRGANVVYAA